MSTSFLTALERMQTYQRRRPAIITAGVQALNRLIPAAANDSHQARVIGQFLLGLYNGEDFPFDLNDLRRLDLALFEDCMLVLLMDYCPEVEVHERVPNGNAIWKKLMDRWAPESYGQ